MKSKIINRKMLAPLIALTVTAGTLTLPNAVLAAPSFNQKIAVCTCIGYKR